jgi:hypothetical protein
MAITIIEDIIIINVKLTFERLRYDIRIKNIDIIINVLNTDNKKNPPALYIRNVIISQPHSNGIHLNPVVIKPNMSCEGTKPLSTINLPVAKCQKTSSSAKILNVVIIIRKRKKKKVNT